MKLAIVIPARNEAALIGATVRRAREGATAPVVVIADRCEDDTAARAAEAGATALVRTDGPSGKGAALAWALDAPELSDVDGLLVLDADSGLRPGSAAALAEALEEGAAAAQGFVHPLPDPGSPASVWAAYSEWLAQALGDRLRGRLGWPVPLRGTGMALRVSTLRELIPQLGTVVEDAELSLLLAARGERIAFVPSAGVDDPKPATARGAARQRARWLKGQVQLLWRHKGLLLGACLRRGPPMWSLASAILAKPKTLFIALKLAALLALWPWRAERAGVVALAAVAALLAKDVLVLGAGAFCAPRAWRGALLRRLVLAPVYVGVWVVAAVLGLFSRDTWLRARD